MLASVQKTRVLVGRRPKIAILTTGARSRRRRATRTRKVVNSNAYALAAMVQEGRGIARPLPIVPDRREATDRGDPVGARLRFIVSTGGVSVGAYDFVKEALDSLGAETKFGAWP